MCLSTRRYDVKELEKQEEERRRKQMEEEESRKKEESLEREEDEKEDENELYGEEIELYVVLCSSVEFENITFFHVSVMSLK